MQKLFWVIAVPVYALGIALTIHTARADERAGEQNTNAKGRVLALSRPPVEWGGLTVGLGPEPAKGYGVAESGGLGVKVEVLAHDSGTDVLTVRVVQSGTDGFRLSREVRLKQFQPFTFSNGTCAGHVFWNREQNVTPADYAVLQIRGYCP